MALKISDEAKVQMPMKTVASLIALVAIGTWAFMLVEHMAGLIESMDEELKGMRNNKINIDFLKEQVSKLQEDVEKLIRNGNGH